MAESANSPKHPAADDATGESQARSFATWTAAATSGAIIAQQVSGKAIRDAFYLTNYPVKTLPTVMVVAASLSLFSVFATSRLLASWSPRRVLPWLFIGSAVGFFLEWVLAQAAPGPAAIIVYFQNSVASPLLISTFWAHINEQYDPYAAKRAVARIGAGGTIGGLVGGLVTWRLSSLVSLRSAVLGLAMINVLCVLGVMLSRIQSGAPRSTRSLLPPAPKDAGLIEPLRVLGKESFLRNLALLVCGGSAISTLLDYVFNAQATAVYGKGASLLAFFSLFGLVVSAGSLLVQLLFGRIAVEKLSVVMNVGFLPAIVLLGGGLGLTVPGLASASVMRGSELIYRNSIFRSAYELFYTPVSPTMKRRTKTIIDVGFDRFGTMVGGALTALAVLTLRPQTIALGVVVVLALFTAYLTRNLHHGYVGALAQGLKDGAKKVDSIKETQQRLTVDDERMHELLSRKAESLGLKPVDHGRATDALANRAALAGVTADLLSGDEARARKALTQWTHQMWPLASLAIVLLHEKTLFSAARAALLTNPAAISGQLVDALLDPGMDLVVRRRIPRILAEAGTQPAADGLLAGIVDEKFEVRYACSRALFALTDAHPNLSVPREAVVAAVLTEAKRLPNEQSRVDEARDSDEDLASRTLVDVMLRERVAHNIEHLFMVLALMLEREPLRLCLRALHQDDPHHRGTALEYLQTVLPDDVRAAVWPLIGDANEPLPAPRPANEVLSELAMPIAAAG